MINLSDLADQLNQYGIINKSFMELTKSEIELLISAVFSNPDENVPADGWSKPTIINDTLILDFTSHPKYHWWNPDGQSIYETLIEIDAPWGVAKKYLGSRGITENDYLNKLIPF